MQLTRIYKIYKFLQKKKINFHEGLGQSTEVKRNTIHSESPFPLSYIGQKSTRTVRTPVTEKLRA